MLFIAINAVAKSFIQEGKERDFYYYTLTSPTAIIISKIIYNNFLMLTLAVVTYVFYYTILHVDIQDPTVFFASVVLGASGFASTLTLISGIASKASNNGALMAV
ncbi:MAG: ABC transporter permease, partial [Idiomarina sp.]